jgi:hypothetical protein
MVQAGRLVQSDRVLLQQQLWRSCSSWVLGVRQWVQHLSSTQLGLHSLHSSCSCCWHCSSLQVVPQGQGSVHLWAQLLHLQHPSSTQLGLQALHSSWGCSSLQVLLQVWSQVQFPRGLTCLGEREACWVEQEAQQGWHWGPGPQQQQHWVH